MAFSLLPVNFTTGIDCEIVHGRVVRVGSESENLPKMRRKSEAKGTKKSEVHRNSLDVAELEKLRKEIDLLKSEIKSSTKLKRMQKKKPKRPKSNIFVIIPYFK